MYFSALLVRHLNIVSPQHGFGSNERDEEMDEKMDEKMDKKMRECLKEVLKEEAWRYAKLPFKIILFLIKPILFIVVGILPGGLAILGIDDDYRHKQQMNVNDPEYKIASTKDGLPKYVRVGTSEEYEDVGF